MAILTFPEELYLSGNFMKLTGLSVQLYFLVLHRAKQTQGDTFKLSYAGLRRKYHFSSARISHGFKQLNKFGFIKLIERGGNGGGDFNLYKLSDRWKDSIKQKIEYNKPTNGFIYVIQSNTSYKIGRTMDMAARHKRYITENPNPIILIFSHYVENVVKIESLLLNKFKGNNIHGEWFDLSKDQLSFIEEYLEMNKIEQLPQFL